MPKFTKKLVVYLDQNFISEMSKADGGDVNVNSQFKTIYELLHRGFIEEKIVSPTSWIHKVESSLNSKLKEQLGNYRAYLGQINMHHPYQVSIFQLDRAARIFLGEKLPEIDLDDVYHDDPDQRVQRFKVDIDMHLENNFTLNDRKIMAANLDQVKLAINKNNITVNQQIGLELEDRIQGIESTNDIPSYLFINKPEKLKEFLTVDAMSNIPNFLINASMWAKILIDHSERPVGNGDPSDIEMISTYLPYVDVLATDTFMAEIIKQLKLDKLYKTEVFGANKAGLTAMETYISDYLISTVPANKPSLSIFVIPDSDIRNDSFDFFKKLGLQIMTQEGSHGNWIELFSFDDGAMPLYINKKHGLPIPFYGLQDVDTIKVDENNSEDTKLAICRKHCRSEKFLLIDRYINLPENFIELVYSGLNNGAEEVLGFRFIKKRSNQDPKVT